MSTGTRQPEPAFELAATVGFGLAVGSPVLFMLVWFGVPYQVSVGSLFVGLALSTASLAVIKRLRSGYLTLALIGLTVSVLIFPLFLLYDRELGRHDFSCWTSVFWGCG